MSTTTITIRDCFGDNKTRTSTHRTTDVDEAVSRAVAKHYGAKYSINYDRGLTLTDRTRYGHIGYSLKSGEFTQDSRRVRVDIAQ